MVFAYDNTGSGASTGDSCVGLAQSMIEFGQCPYVCRNRIRSFRGFQSVCMDIVGADMRQQQYSIMIMTLQQLQALQDTMTVWRK